jgi:hypothetical protein
VEPSPQPTPEKTATAVDRKAFSVSLPGGWTEDTKESDYDRDKLVFFKDSNSSSFSVLILQKSASATVEQQMKDLKGGWLIKIWDAKTSELQNWGNYKGKGFEIQGLLLGKRQTRFRVFVFANAERVCLVSEYAQSYMGDADFETMRRTFKLK